MEVCPETYIWMFADLERKIATELLPTLFGCEISEDERIICSLPTRLGGLNIQNPSMTGKFHYDLSRRSTEFLVESLKRQREFVTDRHIDTLITAQDHFLKVEAQLLEETFSVTVKELDQLQQRALQ